MSRCRLAAYLLLASMLPGCAVGPSYHAPTPKLPEHWHESADDGLASGEADVQHWWRVFEDETLSSLITRAAQDNLDARMAVLRIREARALRSVAAGEMLPSLSGRGRYQCGKASANGPQGGVPATPGKAAQFTETVTRAAATGALSEGISSAAPGAAAVATPLATGLVGLLPSQSKLANSPETDLFTAGFDASWELDFFGGIRRNVESANAGLAAAVEDYHSVLVSLFAEVATTYIDLRTLQAEIAATLKNIELQRETLTLAQARLKYELASELEVRQAEANLATTRSQLPLLEAGLATAIYRLGVLIGREPGALAGELTARQLIPQPPAETFIGVPADVLRRRPDIRAAECRLAAETARIGVAAADLYPRFTLSGTFGFESSDINHMLDNRSITYGFGPAVRWNIFDGLRNLNRIAAQETVTHHAYVLYERTVLVALEDVESAMVYYKREQARRDALRQATAAARRAVELAQTRYEDGLTDFQDVVDAERSLVNLETSLVRSEGQVAVDLVALYKALGGGWMPGVSAQAEHLDTPSDALDRPLHYISTGGTSALPWETQAAKHKPNERKATDDE
jgi:multidrug efflux system outer membrane protein